MMSINSEGNPTPDDASNPTLTELPGLVDEEDDLTQTEPEELPDSYYVVQLTKAFRMAGQRRAWSDFERVRHQLPELKVKQWSMVFTPKVKAALYTETFGPSLCNAVSEQEWMATRTMSEFVQLIAPLKPPHAGEIAEHVTSELLKDLYSGFEDETEFKVIGHEHNGMDIKMDVDLIELRDDPFNGFAEHKLTRVSEFKAEIWPAGSSSDISHQVVRSDSRRPTSNPRTRTYYNCLGMSCLECDYGKLQNTADSILLHLIANSHDGASLDLRLRSKITSTQIISNRVRRPFVTEPSQKKYKNERAAVSRSLGVAAFDQLLDQRSATIFSLID